MVYFALALLGLSLGSFVNALVWRLHAQEEAMEAKPKGLGNRLRKLSIVKGRSMCTHCEHELAVKDLVPVFSWLWLRGKCRYCGKPIDDNPLAELLLPILFIVSYMAWPYALGGWDAIEITVFAVWLLIVTAFLALAVYDARWFLLPDKIVAPATLLAAALVGLLAWQYNDIVILANAVVGALLIGGLFFSLWYISKERWIGGGDVKLAVSLGLLAGTPLKALLVVFVAAVLGTVAVLPLLIRQKYNARSLLPFGPFLLIATFVIFLWGSDIVDWYLGG